MSSTPTKYPVEREVSCHKCGCKMIVLLTRWEESKRKRFYCGRPCSGTFSTKSVQIAVVRILTGKERKITERDREYHIALKKQKLGVFEASNNSIY